MKKKLSCEFRLETIRSNINPKICYECKSVFHRKYAKQQNGSNNSIIIDNQLEWMCANCKEFSNHLFPFENMSDDKFTVEFRTASTNDSATFDDTQLKAN